MLDYNKNPTTQKALIVSSISGMIASIVTHPLWTIKTRIMLTVTQKGLSYNEQNVI